MPRALKKFCCTKVGANRSNTRSTGDLFRERALFSLENMAKSWQNVDCNSQAKQFEAFCNCESQSAERRLKICV